MITFDTLYKLDTKGNIREWRMEVDGDKYRTIAGLQDGQQVTSEWTTVESKNVGRSNETTPEEQAISEVKSHYQKKLDVDYFENVEDINTPKIFKPMLAQSWDKRKDKIKYDNKIGVFIQPKLDGIRCIATSRGLFSRTGKPIVAVPHIEEALEPFFDQYPNAILDGELYNHELKDDFNEIVSMVRKSKSTPEDIEKSAKMVQYHVYDFPSQGKLNFSERGNNMEQMLYDTGVAVDAYSDDYADQTCIRIVETYTCFSEEVIDGVYAECMLRGYEGGIVRIDAPYEQKRSNSLLKRKDFQDEEFEIIRLEEGTGNWSGMVKTVVFKNNDGREVGSGLKGNQEYAKQLLEEADDYIGKQVTIQFFTRTPDGVPRFPIAKALHKDKRW